MKFEIKTEKISQLRNFDEKVKLNFKQVVLKRSELLKLIPHRPFFLRDMEITAPFVNGKISILGPNRSVRLRGRAMIPKSFNGYLIHRIYPMLPATIQIDIFDHAVMTAMEFFAQKTGSWNFIGYDKHVTPVISKLKVKFMRVYDRTEYLKNKINFFFSTRFRRINGETWGHVEQAYLYDDDGKICDMSNSIISFVFIPQHYLKNLLELKDK